MDHQSSAVQMVPQSPRDLPAVEAIDLVRRFGPLHALNQVSLTIQSGEFFSLLGPSGCGKTTLLRIIAGLDLPDGGILRIGGRNAESFPAHKRPVNTVFQSYALFPHLNVRDNVAFGLRMKKVAVAETVRRVDEVMALAKISDLAHRHPGQLSGGQKQRVALARAIVNEPEVLLLDEPLGALDLKLRRQLQVELHQLQRRLGITFIYVTHDQEEALAMSDRIAVMNAGKIEQLGTAKQLYERPRTRFVADFLGSCNLVDGRVSEVGGSLIVLATPLGTLEVNVDALPGWMLKPGCQACLAFRPEKVALFKPGAHGGGNQIPALIQDVVYSGAETRYHLRAAGRLVTAVVLNAGTGHTGFHPGDEVVCEVDKQALVVLEP